MSDRVVLLLATYNGERFLEQQLESVLAQTHRNWLLLARDDGSSDSTREMLERFASRDARVRLIGDDGARLGAAGNFMRLVRECQEPSPFFAFVDQDDVWHPDKLEVLVGVARGTSGPRLVYSNARVTRGEEPTGERLLLLRPNDLDSVLFLNGGVHGCTMLFDRELLELVRAYEGPVAMHDHLVTLTAAALGQLVYIDADLLDYRQHGANVTAGFRTGLVRKLAGFLRSGGPVVDEVHARATLAFRDFHRARLGPSQLRKFSAFERFFSGAGRLERLRIVRREGFRLGDGRSVLLLKTLLRPPVGAVR